MTSKGGIPKSKAATNRRRKHIDKDENRPKNDALLSEDWTDGCSETDEKHLLSLSKKIRRAEEAARKDIWKSNDALRKAVVRSSLRLATGEDGSDSLFLLHEHENSLIKSSRVCVKEATETKDEEEQLPRLLLATHTIRALVPFVTKMTTQEALLQLLYHIVNVLGNGKFTGDPTLLLLAFEALHHLLMRYKKEASGVKLSFNTVAQEDVFVFPVPIFKKQSSTKDDSGLSVNKIFTIVIQAIFFVGKSLLNLCRTEERHSLPYFFCRLHQQPQSVARHLLTSAAIFWIHTEAKITKNLKDGTSHCKRIHRLLWEHAANAAESPTECLEFRQDSLSVLLTGESSSLCKALECKFGETACTYAWKASAAFAAQIEQPGNSQPSLERFHLCIGPHLDRMFEGKPGFSYLEYCSFRAQHMGIEPPPADSVVSPAHKHMYAVLRLALLCVSVNRSLARTENDSEISLEQLDTIDGVSMFHDVFFGDTSFDFPWSSDDVSRITKIIPVAGLHKSLYNSIKDNETSASSRHALLKGAQVMTQCLGPFFLVAARNIKEERSKLCEKAIDCFLRAAAVFELEELRNGENDEMAKAAKQLLSMSTNLLLLSKETSSCFEKFAKVSHFVYVALDRSSHVAHSHISIVPVKLRQEARRDGIIPRRL